MPQTALHDDSLRQALIALVSNIARALVDQPSRIAVTAAAEPQATTVILTVDGTDYGKVTGQQGRTAQSLRTILYAIGQRTGEHFQLNIRSHPQA